MVLMGSCGGWGINGHWNLNFFFYLILFCNVTENRWVSLLMCIAFQCSQLDVNISRPVWPGVAHSPKAIGGWIKHSLLHTSGKGGGIKNTTRYNQQTLVRDRGEVDVWRWGCFGVEGRQTDHEDFAYTCVCLETESLTVKWMDFNNTNSSKSFGSIKRHKLKHFVGPLAHSVYSIMCFVRQKHKEIQYTCNIFGRICTNIKVGSVIHFQHLSNI